MGNNKAGIFCSFLILVSIQTEIFAADIYSNIWAVKVRGSVQEARQLAAKHGFIYGRHVSVDVFLAFHDQPFPFIAKRGTISDSPKSLKYTI